MQMSDIKLEELVKTYLTIRNERDTLTRQHEAKDAELNAEMQQLEQVMMSACNEIQAESIKTGSGTIIKSLSEKYVCNDWNNLKEFIIENNAVDLLQQRLHQANFKEFIVSRKEEGLPPGISTLREFTITVKKPTNH
jgi:hypothetical protein